ncbi:hypothetical protein OOJ96_15515 [Pseudomonas sp. 15FMM2]|uniref:Uncharacterized protein n=1 Tax=Pseudomonas imrae TaxID=2992837 RepID=A0ACC7PGY7_9PSED
MSDFSVNDFLTGRSRKSDFNTFDYGSDLWNRRFHWLLAVGACLLRAKFSGVCRAPSAGNCATLPPVYRSKILKEKHDVQGAG